jgi:hypothetical protein
VKYLFIILSILLISTSMFGQETGVLYQHETGSGFVWKTFGDGKVQPEYKGEIINGKMDGFGFTKYPSDGKSVIGEWKNGKEWNTKHTKNDGTILGNFENGDWIVKLGIIYLGYRDGEIGFYNEKWEGLESEENIDLGKYEGVSNNGLSLGILNSTDGMKKYLGEFNHGKYNGLGAMTYPNGWKYFGKWKNGKREGQGTIIYPNKDKYIGEWIDDKWNGSGTYYYSNGDKYVGVIYGKPNGQGELTTLDGIKYTGKLKDRLFSGQGTYTEPNGYIYKGGFSFGWKSGKGTEIFSDGRKYIGEFKLNKPNGIGIEISPNGTKYEGNFIDGKFNGDIKITLPDGTKYEGEGINGEIKGYGKYTFTDGIIFRGKYFKYMGVKSWTGHTYTSDGSEFIGDWKNGKPWNGTFYFKNKNVKGKYINGLELK